MPVRVLITVTTPSAEACAAAIAQRVDPCRRAEAEEDGCLQYEVFQSALHPHRYVLCELWESKAIYDKHWHLQQEREKLNPPQPPQPSKPGEFERSVKAEFYTYQLFQKIDAVWTPADPAERSETIRWTH